jgi:hypothetical protein
MSIVISTVEIIASGREADIVILLASGGGTYLFDSSNESLQDTSTAKVVFTVVSRGYTGSSLGTITRTVYGTIVSRHSGIEPSGGGTFEVAEDVVGGVNLKIRIALSEPIYAKDKTGAGNSGTDPVVNILANWYTESAVGTAATGAGFAVTNSSTLAYFVPFGQWSDLPNERVSSNFHLGFSARHCHGIAAVVMTAIGATSSHSQASGDVTTQNARLLTATGFVVNEYSTTIPISGYTQGEDIDLRCLAYPTVGDTALDTDNFTTGGGYAVLEGRGPRHFVCDKNDAVRAYGCVDSVNGNDGTGVVSTTLATAEASPYATWKGAIDGGATHIYFVDVGPHNLNTRSTNKSASFSITCEPHPNQASTVSCVIADNIGNLKIAPCKFKNLTIKLAGTLTFWGGSGSSALIYEDCYMDNNTFTLAELDYDFDGLYWKNCIFSDHSKWTLQGGGGDRHRLWLEGCKSNTTATTFKFRNVWRMVACDFPGGRFYLSHAGDTAELPRNVLWETSRHLSCTDGNNFTNDIDGDVSEISICGNLVEGITASLAGTPIATIVEGTQHTVSHVIIAHNTLVGERVNAFYDDGAAGQTSIGIKCCGNILGEWNCATDLTHNSGPYTGRVGRWWYHFATQAYAIVTQDTTATFRPHPSYTKYCGIDSTADGVGATFVNDLTGSTGGGDYNLQPGSVGLGILTAGVAVLAYDQIGRIIPNDGSGAVGALQPASGSVTIMLV